jgi:UDP-N-acetylglucosamine--N-acetylmuramyl-(pentapeptide) pyrophosphoryl-undecaprenol N-acetylglucosamine transferase
MIGPFIPDLARAMAAADIIIARAGALTIAEITARGLPAVLVPFPHAAADHQTQNARALADAGAAVLIDDAVLGTTDLLRCCSEIVGDKERHIRMKESSRKLGRPQATASIVEEILRNGSRSSTSSGSEGSGCRALPR